MANVKRVVSIEKIEEYAKNITAVKAIAHPVKAKEFIQESKNWYRNAKKISSGNFKRIKY